MTLMVFGLAKSISLSRNLKFYHLLLRSERRVLDSGEGGSVPVVMGFGECGSVPVVMGFGEDVGFGGH